MIDIPNDAWRIVISYLSPQALFRLGLTSKRFKQLSFESPIWKIFCNRDFEGYVKNPFRTYLRCKKGSWKLLQEIEAGSVNCLGFKGADYVVSQRKKIMTYSSAGIQSTIEINSKNFTQHMICNNDYIAASLIKIKLWNWAGKSIHALQGHKSLVRTLVHDNKRLISGSLDCTIRIWDIETKVSTILKDEQTIQSLSLFDNELISGADCYHTNCNIQLWDLRTHRKVARFDNEHSTAEQIVRSDNEINSDDGTVWDIRTYKILHQYPDFFCRGLAPDGKRVLVIFQNSLYSYVKNQPPKLLFSSQNTLTCIKRLGDKLIVGSSRELNNKSIYVFENDD